MPGPWQPPTYEPIMLRPGYTDYQCDRCGCPVIDIIAHNRHHKALDEIRIGIIALTKVVVPAIPVGMLLEHIPLDVEIATVNPKEMDDEHHSNG